MYLDQNSFIYGTTVDYWKQVVIINCKNLTAKIEEVVIELDKVLSKCTDIYDSNIIECIIVPYIN
jgi:hypothetical protein